MTRERALVWIAGLALVVACGKSTTKSGGKSPDTTPDAGENDTGGTSTGGSGALGGTAGAGTAGNDDGGEPSEGGAPTGGRGGTSTGGVTSAGSSNAGATAAGAAGATSVRVPDGCTPGSQHVGGLFCSTEMTCDAQRLNVSCQEVRSDLWLCSCSDAETRTDYEFPDANGTRTCEIAAKVCADPDLLTGDETCERTEIESTTTCSLEDSCERLHEIDGVTLRTRAARRSSCSTCFETYVSCCRCADQRAVDYLLRDVGYASGCDLLDELCKPDSTRPIGVKTCDPLWEQTYPDACEAGVECGVPVELGDGTGLTLWERYQTMCIAGEEGMSCTCSDAEGANKLALRFGTSPSNFAHCKAMTAACADLETLVPTGKRSCSPSVSALPSACSVDGECTEPATLAGVDVTIRTYIGARCELQAAGVWQCYCTGTGNRLEVEADDSVGACDQAVEVCPLTSPSL